MSKTVVFITALSLEFRAVKNFLKNCQEVSHPNGTVYEEGEYQNWKVGIAEIGQGDAKAAVETERAIEFFKPEYVFFVGVAGGIKDVNLGDVVIAEVVKGYEKGKETATGFLPCGEVGQSNYGLVQQAKARARNSDWFQNLHTKLEPNALIGVIAAGEKVVASEHCTTYERLTKLYSDAIAVEMEGIGFSTATHANSQVKGIVIRGISDLLNNKAESDNSGWQPKAAHHAAAFAFAMLERLLPSSIDLNKKELQEILKPIAQNLTDEELRQFNGVCLQYVSQESIKNNFFDTLNQLFSLEKLSSKDQYPILCVINHLLKENIIISSDKDKIRAWLDKTVISLRVDLQKVEYSPIKDCSEAENNYLYIKLKRSSKQNEEGQYTIEAWLNDRNIFPDVNDVNGDTNINVFNKEGDEFLQLLQPVIDKLLIEVNKLSGKTLIEFIIPKELMYHNFERLENRRYESDNDPIGICFHIILRPIERVEYRRYMQDLSEYWQRIKQNQILTHDIDDKLFRRLKITERDDITGFLDDNYVCFALDFQVSKTHEQFLHELIKWGTISALWSCQCDDIESMQEDIKGKLFGTKVIDLPESIYKFRRKFKKKCITLFWDNPDKMPPKLKPTSLGI